MATLAAAMVAALAVLGALALLVLVFLWGLAVGARGERPPPKVDLEPRSPPPSQLSWHLHWHGREWSAAFPSTHGMRASAAYRDARSLCSRDPAAK